MPAARRAPENVRVRPMERSFPSHLEARRDERVPHELGVAHGGARAGHQVPYQETPGRHARLGPPRRYDWSRRALQISAGIRESAKPTTSRSLTFSLPPSDLRRTSDRSRGESVHGERGGGEWCAGRENFVWVRRVSTETPAHSVSEAGSPPSDVERVGDGDGDAGRGARLRRRAVATCAHSGRFWMTNAPPCEPGLGASRGRADAGNQTALFSRRMRTSTIRTKSQRSSLSARPSVGVARRQSAFSKARRWPRSSPRSRTHPGARLARPIPGGSPLPFGSARCRGHVSALPPPTRHPCPCLWTSASSC